MHKSYLRTAFILAAITIAMGAFGAHGLRDKVSERALEVFETAVLYQFFHVVALALAGILFKEYHNKYIKASGILFIVGMILFSGSLYLLTYATASGSTAFKWLGPVTPVGGLAFITGWVVLAMGIRVKKM